MKVLVKALLLLASSAAIADSTVELQGELTQGSLIQGKTMPGNQVLFNNQPLQISPEGLFVFGVGRDAAKEQLLQVITPEGQQQDIQVLLSQREYDIQRITGVAQKYVSPPAEVTARIQADNQKVRSVRQTLTNDQYIFKPPVKPAEGRITGVYGSQRIFNGEPRNPHFGLDIAAPVGTEVIAAWSGTVLLAEDLYFSGLTLIIDHGFGVSSTYMHLSKFNVQAGDKVKQGQKIAEIGATGRVTGPHLDWRLNWFQERLDPALLLPAL